MMTLAQIATHLDSAAASLEHLAQSPAIAVRSSELRGSREHIRVARAALIPLGRDLRSMHTLLVMVLAPEPTADDSREVPDPCPSPQTTPKPCATSAKT